MRGSTQSRSFRTFFMISLLLPVWAAPQVSAAQDGTCDWQRGDLHKMHWPQLPDLGASGVGVNLSGVAAADDFRCSATGPVQNIHLWGSFLDNVLPENGPADLTVELSLYADVPGDEKTPSQPGELLWNQTFAPGQYTVRAVHDGPGTWYEPTTAEYHAENRVQTFQYNFCADTPFVQREGAVYWLSVNVPDVDTESSFAWMSTGRQRRWNEAAVYLPEDSEDWLPLAYVEEHPWADQALDLAFAVTNDEGTVSDHDLGDAPDSSNSLAAADTPAYTNGVIGNYPTVYQAGSPPYGPLHLSPRDAFYLGRWVSLENEADLGPDEDIANNLGPASGAANGDGADDSLQYPVIMPSCEQVTLSYTLTATSSLAGRVYLNVWCDWNRDGDWNDTIECPDGKKVCEWAVQDDRPFIPEIGTFTLKTPAFACWHPETDGAPTPLWVRITLSERPWAGDPGAGGSGPAGGYQYGETEDYLIEPRNEREPAVYDWGDAPDEPNAAGYPTLAVHDGASHVLGGPWFGTALDKPDAEADGQPHPAALGDNGSANSDENGVSIPPLVLGEPVSITLRIGGGGGVVQGWIDFDGDLTWQSDEQIVDAFLPDGVHSVPFDMPSRAVTGHTFARLRISTAGGLDPNGAAPDGEVEDHEVWIRPPAPWDAKWCQWPDMTPGGIDIRVDGNNAEPRVLADDYVCTSQDRLTLIRLWGSWKNGQRGQIKRIHVSIHPDDPAGSAGPDSSNPFSKPAPETLWDKVFFTGQFDETLYYAARVAGQWWWDVSSGDLIGAADHNLWQLDLKVDPSEAFLQEGSPEEPRVYWLAVAVETTEGQFGWRVRRWPDHSLDDATMDIGSSSRRPWQELRYPEGHPACDLEMNSVDLAFCLLFTPDPPDQVTSRPASVTYCPAVETQCPATETQCPAVTTLCPTVATTCPAVVTQCPAVTTLCPSGQTSCPSTVTQCPPVETRCPATATQCPTMTTQCPAVSTQCPAGVTQCPALHTACPPSETSCPTTATKCPVFETQCPATATQCPAMKTECPAVATQCPAGVTQCPPMQTQCPPTPTECPVVVTQCPVTETRCPATSTACPPIHTECPAVSTQCPMTVTQCPITCQSVSDGTVLQRAVPAISAAPCPVVEAKCPTVAEYVTIAAAR
ncbi:MAG: hypothetical protein JW993_12815 [Sedimentisphaerales bacterium]|nr:hypothetical protein [Sedimentisphaerales bacterium]